MPLLKKALLKKPSKKGKGLTGKKKAVKHLTNPWAIREEDISRFGEATMSGTAAALGSRALGGIEAMGVVLVVLGIAGVKGARRAKLAWSLRAAQGRPRLANELAKEWMKKGRADVASRIVVLGSYPRSQRLRARKKKKPLAKE